MKNESFQAGEMSQVVECLPSKPDSLNSSPSTSKRKNESFTKKKKSLIRIS
jgi:hypothetical protein